MVVENHIGSTRRDSQVCGPYRKGRRQIGAKYVMPRKHPRFIELRKGLPYLNQFGLLAALELGKGSKKGLY